LGFRIRQIASEDLGQVRRIIDVSFSRFSRFFAVYSLQDDGQVLVSEAHGTIVAFAKLREFKLGEEKFGVILWIAVHPLFRRKGIASALVRNAVQRFKLDGSKMVFACVNRRNVASLTVFSLLGFRKMGIFELWRLFRGDVFRLYSEIWIAPGEIVFMHE